MKVSYYYYYLMKILLEKRSKIKKKLERNLCPMVQEDVTIRLTPQLSITYFVFFYKKKKVNCCMKNSKR